MQNQQQIQQSQSPPVSAEELGQRWGALLNQAHIAIIALEKQLISQNNLIAEMTKNEAGLVENVTTLEREAILADDTLNARQKIINRLTDNEDKLKRKIVEIETELADAKDRAKDAQIKHGIIENKKAAPLSERL